MLFNYFKKMRELNDLRTRLKIASISHSVTAARLSKTAEDISKENLRRAKQNYFNPIRRPQ